MATFVKGVEAIKFRVSSLIHFDSSLNSISYFSNHYHVTGVGGMGRTRMEGGEGGGEKVVEE